MLLAIVNSKFAGQQSFQMTRKTHCTAWLVNPSSPHMKRGAHMWTCYELCSVKLLAHDSA